MEGVKIEKGIESSKAADRTAHKAARVRNYRIKLRKIRLLRILSDAHLCPPLSKVELSAWRLKKEYPKNDLFMQWQGTDDESEKTPYAYRHKCLHECLDFNSMTDRYIFFYFSCIITTLIFTITQKATTLNYVIKSTPQNIPISHAVEI